jgi:hypothetical protein
MKTMAAERPLSQVERNFQTNPIDSDLRTVPGLGPAGIRHLNEQNINTTEELVGRFFMCNRDELMFLEWLCDAGIKGCHMHIGTMSCNHCKNTRVFANECAENMVRKFGSL